MYTNYRKPCFSKIFPESLREQIILANISKREARIGNNHERDEKGAFIQILKLLELHAKASIDFIIRTLGIADTSAYGRIRELSDSKYVKHCQEYRGRRRSTETFVEITDAGRRFLAARREAA